MAEIKYDLDQNYREMIGKLAGGSSLVRLEGLQGSARSLLAARIFRDLGKTIVLIASSEKEAREFARDLVLFLGEKEVGLYPSGELLTLEMFAKDRAAEIARLEVLFRLLAGESLVVVISAQGLLQKTIPKGVYTEQVGMFSKGCFLDREELVSQLVSGGYERVSLVEGKGQFALRGNIIDIFPLSYDRPRRIELCGDEVDSVRSFDPVSQRSTGEVDELYVTPAVEAVLTRERRISAAENVRRQAEELGLPGQVKTRFVEAVRDEQPGPMNPLYLPLIYGEISSGGGLGDRENSRFSAGCIFDYLPWDAALILLEPPLIERGIEALFNDLDRLIFKSASDGGFYLNRLSFWPQKEEVKERVRRYQRLAIEGLPGSTKDPLEGTGGETFTFTTEILTGIKTALTDRTRQEGLLAPLAGRIRAWIKEGFQVAFFTSGPEEGQRIAHLFKMYDLPPAEAGGPFLDELAASPRGRLILREGHLAEGFQMNGLKLVVLTEEGIFGKKAHRLPAKPAREGAFLASFGELKEGDFVVHTDCGIGLYQGLRRLSVADLANDYLLIEYLGGDKLYIPVDRIAVIQRYLGPDGFRPRLDKLGGTSWESTKEKVKASIREVAEELVALYATREVTERQPFSPVDAFYEEFCSSFEYEETADQARAIADIIVDMDRPKPMDRLICGDAGFGKTEVALRAAFRAIADGKQVAILTPTTILAEQHYQTFLRRFKDFPVCIGALNRFKAKGEIKDILAGLDKGMMDVVIGTHRLLQKDVKFKNLGLLIIDEEHRFGVTDKEKLKKMRNLVDVLSISATPIPRTLHLSLVGIRDLSIISTPPAERIPIKTYVLEFGEELIRDAIRREMERGGQVFFVHDRINSIYSLARLIQRLSPEARPAIVHGRMPPKEIEEVMGRFVRGECDVLICTSIIASGIDIPAANTIIVNRADRFGLAQLYQIRGRVGRAKEEALAYLLVPKGAMLSARARKRLQAIETLSEAGSGFRIAGNDLELRGGGNILGTSQSGHIQAIGYELYVELMEKTIAEIKGEAAPEQKLDPEITLGIPAYLPEEYLAAPQRRLTTYKRISLAGGEEDLAAIREELRDCLGPLPREADNLFAVMEIKIALKGIKGKKMGYDGRNFSLSFDEQGKPDPEKIVAFCRGRRNVRLTPDGRLAIAAPQLKGAVILKEAREIVRALS